ncbi:glycolate oxidase [Nitzschia inconspicua]|uniref:Glycolate oxidase n=1 Tax=Nitzschia inconspicua TaxID=303405 RepID=A0A9K3LTY4_9STRA|nr:glycolate oxidase [Nitzschia inconspicua]
MKYLPEMTTKTLQSRRSHGEGISTTEVHSSPKNYIQMLDFRDNCYNVNDFQILAKRYLPKELYEYLASGTDDAQTLNENRAAFQRWFLRPRVLRPVGNLSTRTTLFSHTVTMPVFVSPAGVHALCHEGGECATARACAKAGILFGLSQHSTRSIEDVRRSTIATHPNAIQFYQAYILKDRSQTLRLVRRAIHEGYQGIILTVDSVRFGYREPDARNGFNALPPPHRLVNYDEPDADNDDTPTTTTNNNNPTLDQTYNSQEKKAWDQNSEQMFEQNVTWNDVTWLKSALPTNMPLVIKGIMTAEDAVLAMEAGADGIMVSNHGGRQLDGCLATIDALPEIAYAVRGHVPIWLDSGVRRGTDVLKALALGASAVGIGKPLFFALSVGGEESVSFMLELLRTEIEAAMAICGMERITDITPNLVTRHPSLFSQPTPTLSNLRSCL